MLKAGLGNIFLPLLDFLLQLQNLFSGHHIPIPSLSAPSNWGRTKDFLVEPIWSTIVSFFEVLVAFHVNVKVSFARLPILFSVFVFMLSTLLVTDFAHED